MDSSQEYPLAAGLLAALSSTLTATPIPTPIQTPISLTSPTPTPSPYPFSIFSSLGHDHEHKGGEYEWSSLIGIITALAGNVLISLALNIQRYAHIRIDKEWEHEKAQQNGNSNGNGNWKRSHRRNVSGSSYGAVEGPVERYQDEPSVQSDPYRDEESDCDGEEDGLLDSPVSDRTVQGGNGNENGSGAGRRKSYLRSPYWWAGIILMTLGETGNFMAYGFAPASIVSPLGVVALISNCVIAPFMLKEKFRKRDFWGVLVAIAGAVVVVLSAKSSEEKIGPHDIWVMITQWEFELYLGLTAGLIVALMWASSKYGPRTILIDVGLVALFGGYTALSTKGVSSLLSFTLWHIITFPITYLLVFILVFSALMQIRYINRALQRFDSTQVIPTQFVLFTLSVIIGSAILYRDFEAYTAGRAAKFVGGCLLTFLGVYFITSGRVRADDESSYSTDEEEAIGLLPGERYQDRVDLSPPLPAQTKNKPRPRSPDLLDGALQSPAGSLLSQGIEDLDDSHSTPRAGISVTSPSPAGSVAADSLAEPSPGSSSSSQPISLLRNPWAESLERTTSEPQPERPSTPPAGEPLQKATTSTVLLRFPPAPDADGPGAPDATNPRTNTVPQTPPTRKARNSISTHFSPGPLFSTLSGGFSAVVADSIRRGEMSPVKERRTPRPRNRKKHPSTSVLENILRDSEGGVGAEGLLQDPDAGVWGDNPRASTVTAPADPDGLATAPVSVGQLTPGVEGGEILRNNSDDPTTISRLRSLSDSWSKSVPWLGGVLQKRKESQGQSQSQKGSDEAPTQAPTQAEGPSNQDN